MVAINNISPAPSTSPAPSSSLSTHRSSLSTRIHTPCDFNLALARFKVTAFEALQRLIQDPSTPPDEIRRSAAILAKADFLSMPKAVSQQESDRCGYTPDADWGKGGYPDIDDEPHKDIRANITFARFEAARLAGIADYEASKKAKADQAAATAQNSTAQTSPTTTPPNQPPASPPLSTQHSSLSTFSSSPLRPSAPSATSAYSPAPAHNTASPPHPQSPRSSRPGPSPP